MSARKYSPVEMRRRLKAADLAIKLREGMTDSERLACQQWRANPENDRALREAETMLLAVSTLSRSQVSMPEPRHRVFSRPAIALAASIAGLGVIGGGVWVVGRSMDDGQQFVTEAAEWRDGTLKDGSGVMLGPGTALNFKLSKKQRTVAFEHGEALFNVKTAEQPFVVQHGSVSVKAVGTEFAVKQLDGPPEVTVKEGKVQVAREADREGAVYVSAGEQLTITAGKPLKVDKVDVDAELASITRRLNITGMTIAQVVAEFNRRNVVQIEIDEDSVPTDTTLDGLAKLDDPQSFVKWLAFTQNLVVDDKLPNVLRLTAVRTAAQ